MVYQEDIKINTKGFSDIINITDYIKSIVSKSGISTGMVNIFGIGSTNTISIIEYEPALIADVQELLEKLVPSTMRSRHSETWGDDNGFSHMRATILGCETNAPVTEGQIYLGIWQQIILIDHDNRSRSRNIRVTVIGE